ncbi:NAD-dependent epimerase/dehydratase family protein [Sagittula sp.]|uniref:NAD-dependent epimerase/dehydratase family protein n=1 Tax=Sagittula sp. TaxID=2038081 RepID=UPI003512659B
MSDTTLSGERNCLIGHTGFVGGTLTRQTSFAAQFNSRTISGIGGQGFDTVVCAAAPGSMFEANKFPERDEAQIQALIERLSAVEAKRFVLISSIAVLADFAGGDDETTTAFQDKLAYGRHRRALEAFVEERFADSLVVRLPALFGHGLRKNFIFDLLNPVPSMLTEAKLADLSAALDDGLAAWLKTLYAPDPVTGMVKVDRTKLDSDPRRAALEEAVTDLGFSATQFHNPETTYQYYDMSRLWSDIGTASAAGLSHIHLVSEPLRAARIHERLTGRAMPDTGARLHHEDMQTRHAGLWGRTGRYLDDADSVLDRLAGFFGAERQPS